MNQFLGSSFNFQDYDDLFLVDEPIASSTSASLSSAAAAASLIVDNNRAASAFQRSQSPIFPSKSPSPNLFTYFENGKNNNFDANTILNFDWNEHNEQQQQHTDNGNDITTMSGIASSFCSPPLHTSQYDQLWRFNDDDDYQNQTLFHDASAHGISQTNWGDLIAEKNKQNGCDKNGWNDCFNLRSFADALSIDDQNAIYWRPTIANQQVFGKKVIGRTINYYQRFGWECVEIPEERKKTIASLVKYLYGIKETDNDDRLARNNINRASVKKRETSERPPKNLDKNRECSFCKNLESQKNHYKTHWLKDKEKKITCPILRAYNCPTCNNGGGDYAHTVRYCPLRRVQIANDLEERMHRKDCQNNAIVGY